MEFLNFFKTTSSNRWQSINVDLGVVQAHLQRVPCGRRGWYAGLPVVVRPLHLQR